MLQQIGKCVCAIDRDLRPAALLMTFTHTFGFFAILKTKFCFPPILVCEKTK